MRESNKRRNKNDVVLSVFRVNYFISIFSNDLFNGSLAIVEPESTNINDFYNPDDDLCWSNGVDRN